MDTQTLRRKAAKPLTERAILALKPGQKRADGSMASGSGRLIVRARKRDEHSVRREFYYRYHDTQGIERSILLGIHGSGTGFLTLEEARDKARDQRDLVKQDIDPQAQRARVEQANREADERARLDQRKGSLADLLDAYVVSQRAASKVSADDTERTLKRHVTEPFPALAAKKARDITADDITDVLARMISKGIERRTNIVRALLRAAFAFGAKLDNDPLRKAAALKSSESESAKLFGITGNPVADVRRIADYDRAGDRVLSDDELKHYWNALTPLHPAIGDALRVALLLGGQRMSQLKRLTWSDYDAENRVLTLRDAKGRGGMREHVLPVSDRVAAILASRKAFGGEGYIFSTGDGTKQIDLATLSSNVTGIARKFWPKDHARAYSAADIRRTVETRLAALGVSKDHRAQVLSHGLKRDVQVKHYDRHDYIPEKATALARWEAHLVDEVVQGVAPKVIQGRFRSTESARVA